jgi:hypothetical protein
MRDRGNATLEFIGIAVVMMVPIAYAMVAFAQLQSAVYAVSGAAQVAGRAYVQASSDFIGRYAAARSAAVAGRNHGLVITMDNLTITCDVANCLTPGTTVFVRVQAVAHIGAGPFARNLPLHSSSTFVVDPYRTVPA